MVSLPPVATDPAIIIPVATVVSATFLALAMWAAYLLGSARAKVADADRLDESRRSQIEFLEAEVDRLEGEVADLEAELASHEEEMQQIEELFGNAE